METEVGVEGNDEGKFEEAGFGKTYSSLSSTKQLTDPVVYKLVRVEGDGRLVPATDDEVMEVKGLLIDEKSEMHIVADIGQPIGCISNEGSSSGMLLQLESSEGLSQFENTEVDPDKLNARLEYIEEMLQKVKEEERLRLACGSRDYSSAYVIVDSQCSDQLDKLPGIDENLQSEIPLQETVPSFTPSLIDSHLHQSGSIDECSNTPVLTEGGALPSTTVTTSKPDFSKLNGEICLDNLSIKELHETFKATFGRETTVKDKQWLKRRITMGLTNSCDVSATTFIIKDNKLVKKGKEDGCDNVDGALAYNLAVGTTINCSQQGAPISHGSQLEDQVVSDKRNRSTGDNSGSEDHHTEQRAAKRVRKPTRRYIEELSEVESKESSGKLRTTVKSSAFGQMSSKFHFRPVRNVSSDGRTVVTRLDSLGGSGIQIPCVSRVRRSRPRKNFMALLKFNPNSMGMTATLVKKALGAHSFLPDNYESEKAQSAPAQVQQRFLGVPDKDKQFTAIGAVGGHHKVLKQVDSSGDSDDNIVTVPTSKGGIRRKHHRAWTLSEVMKLVEGVSRYGAGRWSEIKRLAFASYSYRTSVDLKDKWRNLLKASFAHIPSDKGVNSRKNAATMPIPEPILLRVRELAERQSQVPPNLTSGKEAGSSGSSVHEKQSGYL
ncbi:hypothetical protein P3X46_011182 [Hevea brasiliensis]|uniref:Myb-like domain-containing protein n=1 Tax=Hevea brasiliensis TaxID=3981 RepID=A0ABQ9MJ37_HEVBR|nr:uncharacterized protein LOC110664287 isoform X2 [Hevea brasiliensis]KAJ9179390.1 hypothetical protein P3X46_011182 [Hevea brasiliensis]